MPDWESMSGPRAPRSVPESGSVRRELNPALSTRRLRIEPKLTMRGTQLAGWTPRQTRRTLAEGILFDGDVRIPMSDGVELVADLFRPAGTGPVPVLVSWAVYVKDTDNLGGGPFIDEAGINPWVIKNGYAVLRVQPRGTGKSGGASPEQFNLPQEAADGHVAIEWAAAQTWCNGSVGMTGMSNFAVAQLLIAETRPPSLKAIFPYKALTDVYRHGFFKGGAPFSGMIELFAAFEKVTPPRIPARLRFALSHVLNSPRFAMETSDSVKTQRTTRKYLRKHQPSEAALRGYLARMFDRTFDDDGFWQSVSVGPNIEQIDIPVCIATDVGAQDLHLLGAFDLWHRLLGTKFLFIGPPEYTFPWSNYQEELVAWYDWQLKGIDNGYADLPAVRYYLRGADRWHSATDWPLPQATVQRLYLAPSADESLEPQVLQPTSPQPDARSFLAVPSTSYLVPGVETLETQVLRFRTEPYETDTDVVGPVVLGLTLTATAIDTYLVARLSDIAPDGTRTKLSWGWLLASHRTEDPARSNPTEIVHNHSSAAATQLIPGQPTQLRFSLNPLANQFRRGHRMELEIASRPELVGTEKGEGFDMFLWDPVPYRSRNTVTLGGEQASYLEVAVLPEAATPVRRASAAIPIPVIHSVTGS